MPFIEHGGRRILFMHVPRTGGTSIEDWLRGIAPLRLFAVGAPSTLRVTPQHLTATDLRMLFGEDFFDYSFVVVRNPFTRIVSEYRLRAALQMEGFFKGSSTFHDWLETAARQVRQNQWHLDNHIRPQWQFVSKRARLFRFEDGIDTIMRAVAEDVGLPPPTEAPHRGSTGGSALPIDWDLPEIGLMHELYRRDFEQFGYDGTPPE